MLSPDGSMVSGMTSGGKKKERLSSKGGKRLPPIFMAGKTLDFRAFRVEIAAGRWRLRYCSRSVVSK
jgi:hypothetical protein